ncbi:hypothetical protein JXB41_05350 [Candidatus Woesearchaeota archaeon]|nr:hypothetical protein [Candidatus Woesearchaeota archaeon]
MSILIDKSYQELYNKECPYGTSLRYSKAFKGYNANVWYNKIELKFRLSFKWKDVSPEIKRGLIQSLLNRVFKTKINTIYIDMYNIFLKKVHLAIPKTTINPVLLESFNRVNEKYFQGMVLMPNLVLGNESISKLGSYDYGTDSITISKILVKEQLLMDYVMYHEILHKKLKFKDKNGRSYHHTREFKKREKQFEDPEIEDKLKKFLKKHRFKRILRFW